MSAIAQVIFLFRFFPIVKRKLFSISGKIALDLAHLIIFLQLLSPFCEIQVVLHDCFFFLIARV